MKRKIAAILAADAAEYSRLVAEDEEEALRQLVASVEVFKASIQTHGGRIFNTAGDAVLAEFQSAVEAVRSAIDIQERLSVRNQVYAPKQRMMFRMGISIGDVVENGGDLLGDGVNIAARLQTLSQPGGVAISRWVQEQVAGKVAREFRDLGNQFVKNMPAPIHVYQFSPTVAVPVAAIPPVAVPVAAEKAEPKVRRPLVAPETMDRIRGFASLVAGVGFLGGVIALFILNRPAPEPVALREAPPASAKLESPARPPKAVERSPAASAKLETPAPRPDAVESSPAPPASTPQQTPAFRSPEQSLGPKEDQASTQPSAPVEAALPPSAAVPNPPPVEAALPSAAALPNSPPVEAALPSAKALPDPAPPAREPPQEFVPIPPTQVAAPPPAPDAANTGLAQDVRPPQSSAPRVPVLAEDTGAGRKQQQKRRCAEVLERAQLGDLTSDDQAFLRGNCR